MRLGSSPADMSVFFLLTGSIREPGGGVSVCPEREAAMLPSPYHDARTLVVVSRDGSSTDAGRRVFRWESFATGSTTAQGVFSDLAFYQIVRKAASHRARRGSGAFGCRASGNLLSLLQTSGFPQRAAAEMRAVAAHVERCGVAQIFPRRSRILPDDVVYLMGEKATIAGVAKPDAWRLPGKAEAWLLENDSRMDALAAYINGICRGAHAAIARAQSIARRWHMTVPQKNGSMCRFCVRVSRALLRVSHSSSSASRADGAAGASCDDILPLGEYPYNPRQQSLCLRLRRWLFFAAKLALILPVVCFASLDVAQMFRRYAICAADCYICAGAGGLRWMLRDQRQRCPVCLQLLRNPVHVGEPSRNFLAWNGTELICVVGHGFLHVPELPTSWFSTQRWLYLDASWRSIFRPQEIARTT